MLSCAAIKAQCVFSIDNGQLPVAANKAIVSNGNAQCSPTLVGLDNVASTKLVASIYELGMTTKFPLLNLASCE